MQNSSMKNEHLKTTILGLFVVTMMACNPKIKGDIHINGKPFEGTACRSGQVYGFSGVEVSNKAGQKLRLMLNVDGTCDAALFAPGSSQGYALGPCGTLVIQSQSSRINSVLNIKGTANLSCASKEYTIAGTVHFENCH